MNHLETYIASNGHKVHKITGIDTASGLPAFYFLLVTSLQKEMALEKALTAGDNINLEEFGQIVASCTGFEPNDEVKKFLQDKYGFTVL